MRSQKSEKSAKSVVKRIPVGRGKKFVKLTFPSAVELNLREISGLLKIIVVYKEVEAYE